MGQRVTMYYYYLPKQDNVIGKVQDLVGESHKSVFFFFKDRERNNKLHCAWRKLNFIFLWLLRFLIFFACDVTCPEMSKKSDILFQL